MTGCTLNRLCERITIQERSLRPDGTGGYKERWKTKGQHWAAVQSVSISSEAVRARTHKGYRLGGFEEPSCLYRVTVRRDIEIKGGMRILWGKCFLTALSDPEQDPRSLYKSVLASFWIQREREAEHV